MKGAAKHANKLYVLYGNTSLHSGRALREALSEKLGERVRGGYAKRFRKMEKDNKLISLVVNLGITDDIPYGRDILNTADMVRASSHKKKARQIFEENNIPAPELFLKAGGIPTKAFPVIGRTSYHSKGRGFWLCKDSRAVSRAANAGATHFLKLIPNTREYRVHTFIKLKYRDVKPQDRKPEHYISMKISEKVWEGKGKPNKDEPQKNFEFGWVFLGQQNRREEELDVIRQVSKQAIAALGMDFGAVDVMYKIRSMTPYVLEVNSTPSLANDQANTCEIYTDRILKIIGAVKDK